MQFARWPKFREAYLRALQRMIAARTDKGLPLYPHHRSAEDWFAWWIEDRTQETADEDQIALEGMFERYETLTEEYKEAQADDVADELLRRRVVQMGLTVKEDAK